MTMSWYLPFLPSNEQSSIRQSCPILVLWATHSWCGTAGSPHASTVRSSDVTFTFSPLDLSNLWHHRPKQPAVAMPFPKEKIILICPSVAPRSCCGGKKIPIFCAACVQFATDAYKASITQETAELTNQHLVPLRQNEGPADESAEMLLQRQEEEVQRLQTQLANRLSRSNFYSADEPLLQPQASALDLQDPLYTPLSLRKNKVCIHCESVLKDVHQKR